MLNDIIKLLESVDTHPQYEAYLTEHIANVQKAYEWMKQNIPEYLSEDNYIEEGAYYGELDEIITRHDASKRNQLPDVDNYYELCCEYDPYAEYFYGEKTPEVTEAFQRAWLSHIHHNPHHWQHWMLQNDEDGLKLLDMPYVFLIEMVADWWSFSWKTDNLTEIFNWYEKRKDGILISDKTRERLHMILDAIKLKLEELTDEQESVTQWESTSTCSDT